MRRLFFAAYSFPPKVSGGTFRVVKFVKYLPEFFPGEIHVVTTVEEGEEGDPGLEADVRGRCVVHRVPPRWDPRFWKREISRRAGDGSAPTLRRALWRLAKVLYVPFYGLYQAVKEPLLAPDGKIFWSLAAAGHIERVLRPAPGDVLLTTSPERSLLVAGRRLKRRRPELRWVVDLRDGFHGHPFDLRKISRFRSWLERRMERGIFQDADRIICATERIEEAYRKRYPWAAGKLVTIFNGYDPQDFEGLEPKRMEGDGLHVVHTGYAGGTRSTYVLLDAIERLKKTHPTVFDVLRIHFVGGFRDDPERWRAALPGRVVFHGRVVHTDALRYMLGAGLLLVLIDTAEGGPTAYTSKIFEYIRAGAPILVVSPPSGASELVERYGLGYTAPDDDPHAIAAALRSAVEDWQTGRGRHATPEEVLKRFDRREAARELAAVLTANG